MWDLPCSPPFLLCPTLEDLLSADCENSPWALFPSSQPQCQCPGTYWPHQQLGNIKYPLVGSVLSGLTWEIRLFSFHGKSTLPWLPGQPGIRTKEAVLWTGSRPGTWCPWHVFLSWNMARRFFLFFLLSVFFNFFPGALISLGMQETWFWNSCLFFLIYANYLLAARESTSK